MLGGFPSEGMESDNKGRNNEFDLESVRPR